MKKYTSLLFAIFLMFAISGPASALSITNGSFEIDGLTGWTTNITGANASVAANTTAYAADGTEYNATDDGGEYFAEITGTASLFQSLSWSAGETLSFDWAFLGEDEVNFNDTAYFQITGVTDQIELASIDSVGSYGYTAWSTYSYTFASDGSGILQFEVDNVFLNDGDFLSRLLIDNVREGAPVPEPATMLLLGSGLFGLAGMRKRFFKK